MVELLLQGLGGGGNDDTATAADGGDQVGQGFAGAGSGFHHGVMMLFEGVVHHFGHFQLAGAMLVAADHATLEEAAGAEDIVHGWGRLRSRLLAGGIELGRRRRAERRADGS